MLGIHRLHLFSGVLHEMVTALGIHQHATHHRFTAQQHPIAHGIPIGERELNRPLLITKHKLLTDHVASLHQSTGVFHAALLHHGCFMTHHHRAVVLERMHFKTDPVLPIPPKRGDVEGMQRRRGCS